MPDARAVDSAYLTQGGPKIAGADSGDAQKAAHAHLESVARKIAARPEANSSRSSQTDESFPNLVMLLARPTPLPLVRHRSGFVG